MSLRINQQKVGLCDLFPTPLICISLVAPSMLQRTEDNNIETLVDVCRVRWIAQDMDVVFACVFEKPKGVVGVMAINKE